MTCGMRGMRRCGSRRWCSWSACWRVLFVGCPFHDRFLILAGRGPAPRYLKVFETDLCFDPLVQRRRRVCATTRRARWRPGASACNRRRCSLRKHGSDGPGNVPVTQAFVTESGPAIESCMASAKKISASPAKGTCLTSGRDFAPPPARSLSVIRTAFVDLTGKAKIRWYYQDFRIPRGSPRFETRRRNRG